MGTRPNGSGTGDRGSRLRRIRKLARDKLGFAALRPEQEAAILSVLGGRDTLAVMPTGSGKSAVYQLAALVLPGPTVVVSPLIALQRDQVESINSQSVAPAAVLNSTVSSGDRRDVWDGLLQGELEFLFLAPEQFSHEATIERLQAARPSLFVIDEAHCISEWGHDFRPEYLRLGAVIEALGRPTVLALTATASPAVQQEICERLGLREPCVLVTGFDRPNIHLAVKVFEVESDKRAVLLSEVERAEKPGIVYASSRRHTEELTAALCERGVRAVAYHAGLRAREREDAQTAFMSEAVDVIVATSAFGMGIDKPNVRFVFHYEACGSIDSYYQEIGRAGRDGQPARAVLFYRPADLAVHKFFAGSGKLSAEQIERVAQALAEQPGPVDTRALTAETQLSGSKVAKALSRLADLGTVETLPTGEVAAAAPAAPAAGDGAPATSLLDAKEAAAEALSQQEARHEQDLLRIEKMRAYAEAFGCRRELLLGYFGEALAPPCRGCDSCESGRTQELQRLSRIKVRAHRRALLRTAAEEAAAEPFPPGCRVRHSEWGLGTVQRKEADNLVVSFEQVGEKLLALALVTERALLARVDRKARAGRGSRVPPEQPPAAR
ncbi:MAG: RecQ family ATP-dependent DNA helicase [Polyangia bacterium]